MAIELSAEVRDALLRFIRQRRADGRDVRWCTPEQLHLTLRFLGELDDARLPRVCELVARASAGLSPFDIRIGGVGCFPSEAAPRVLWAGVTDATQSCARWVAAAEPDFRELGFEAESRPYHPHVTLARARTPAGGAVLRRAAGTEGPAPTAMRVESVALFESRLGPGGAQYVRLMSAALGAAAAPPGASAV